MNYLLFDDFILVYIDPSVKVPLYYKSDVGDKPVFTSSKICCQKFVNRLSAQERQTCLLNLYGLDTNIERLCD